MAGGGSESGTTLEHTPTWAVATVMAVFVLVSLIIERTISFAGKWLKKHNHLSIYEALEKIKEELMLLGFISLLLTVSQNKVAKICVPKDWAQTMLPCKKLASNEENHAQVFERRLAGGGTAGNHCLNKGKSPFVPLEGLHELHILIFFMAVVHVVYSLITMALGTWRVHGWRHWEEEAKTEEYQSAQGGRVRFIRESTFVKKYADSVWSKNSILNYGVAFFQQFFQSVTRIDYLTLRHGFIMTHMSANISFDFHKYILRSLEDDFKHVVGISPFLWAFAVVFILLNVNGWYTYYWLPFLPLIMVLIMGAKLRRIITLMALEITRKNSVVEGIPIVTPKDDFFWFGRPQIMFFLIHFVLFQNAFELSYFYWSLATFGSNSCLHDDRNIILIRLITGVFVQFTCSYVTLPLYALVTQMGSHIKKTIFEEQTAMALEKWRKKARDKAKNKKRRNVSIHENESRSAATVHHDDSVKNDHNVEIGHEEEEEDDDEEASNQNRVEMGMRKMSIIERVTSQIQRRQDITSPNYTTAPHLEEYDSDTIRDLR